LSSLQYLGALEDVLVLRGGKVCELEKVFGLLHIGFRKKLMPRRCENKAFSCAAAHYYTQTICHWVDQRNFRHDGFMIYKIATWLYVYEIHTGDKPAPAGATRQSARKKPEPCKISHLQHSGDLLPVSAWGMTV